MTPWAREFLLWLAPLVAVPVVLLIGNLIAGAVA